MNVYGIIGWKASGKTPLMERLVANFTARSLTVSTVSHVHHDVDPDGLAFTKATTADDLTRLAALAEAAA